MLGTYLSLLLILAVAALVGQGLFSLCGRRDWSWLAPALGLAVLTAVAWGAVNLAGDPVVGAVVIGLFALASAVVIPRARPGTSAVVVIIGSVALASLPFLLEGRFGILGTSLNPDMSQHLFAVDRLANGGAERLIAEGYPLGPHAIVAALSALGPSLVEGFNGLTLAIAVATCLAPLALLDEIAGFWRRALIGLLVGLTYMLASSLIQGSFKETLQALFVLAFAIAVAQAVAGTLGGGLPADRWERWRFVPLAALAAGSIYAYSFPGLTWLIGTIGLVAVLAAAVTSGRLPFRRIAVPAASATVLFLVAVLPEVGRIAEFGSFETFDPEGDGLGNLFGSISAIEALGIWPSGDFRLTAGAGSAPAAAFWLGALVALAGLAYGLLWWVRRGEVVVPAALGAAALIYLYTVAAGTPYQEAKAIVIAAPLATLIAARALLADAEPARPRLAVLAGAYVLLAAACSALTLVNGPVGPAAWGPGLIELREERLIKGPVQALAPPDYLTDEHGAHLVAWELRGGEVCVGETGTSLPPGVPHVVTVTPGGGRPAPPYSGLEELRTSGAYTLWEVTKPERVPQSVCPFIADGDRAGSKPTE
ncbi:MAG: hypothetical protein M3383_08870 [Actinomycetota bacterium]|nr:hypothetical protein [Actinomycetota bacterium]